MPKDDKSYYSQLKSAGILEELFTQNPDQTVVAQQVGQA